MLEDFVKNSKGQAQIYRYQGPMGWKGSGDKLELTTVLFQDV